MLVEAEREPALAVDLDGAIALGVDRLLMCLTGAADIAEVRVQPW